MPIKNYVTTFLLIFSLSGCSSLYDTFVYQIDVTQGNYIDDEKISQIEVGMTQEQVIFVLGSPMLIDQFDSSKWYYIRYIKPGGEDVQQQQVLLVFSEKILVNIQKDKNIEENPLMNDKARSVPSESTENNDDDNDNRA